MTQYSLPFQVFAKPAGPVCNLGCDYCYYLGKERLWPGISSFRMPPAILETYIRQHIQASTDPVICFSWHGGEPALAGLDFFHQVADLQRAYLPPGRRIINGIQTNGILIDEAWCRFLADEHFYVGISLDGPEEMHDVYRRTKTGKPSHECVLRGYRLLKSYGIAPEILCVVHDVNVCHPLEVYRYFRDLEAAFISFIPLVEPDTARESGVGRRSVPSAAYGDFLCTIFDEWRDNDIGRIKVQIFEEAFRTAFGQEHTLCIFRETCGRVPVIEHNGDVYACDHFVDPEHHLGNILEMPFIDLLERPEQIAFGKSKRDRLPSYCRKCDVLAMCNGGCPKNRIIFSPDGEPGLNYLCAGYKRFFNHCRPFVQEIARMVSRSL